MKDREAQHNSSRVKHSPPEVKCDISLGAITPRASNLPRPHVLAKHRWSGRIQRLCARRAPQLFSHLTIPQASSRAGECPQEHCVLSFGSEYQQHQIGWTAVDGTEVHRRLKAGEHAVRLRQGGHGRVRDRDTSADAKRSQIAARENGITDVVIIKAGLVTGQARERLHDMVFPRRLQARHHAFRRD
jgi:hypothetical protein